MSEASKTRDEIRQLSEEHVGRVREAAITLGRTLNEAAAVGHGSGYFSGYTDAQEAARQRIAQLEAEVARLTAMQDAYKVAALENANTRIMELEAEVARLTEQIAYLQTISTEQVERIRALEPKDWTEEKPTVPGWYWYYSEVDVLQIVYVYPGNVGLWVDRGCGNSESLVEFDGKWAGPIPTPEEP